MAIYIVILMGILSQLAFSGSRMSVSLYALELGASQFAVGVLIALYAVFPTLLAIFIGKFADRVAPWLPLTIGMVAIFFALLLPPMFQSMAALYVACAILGLGHQFFLIPVEAGVGGIGGADKRAANYALLSMGWSIANFLGPLTAGYCIEYIGHVRVFWVLSIISLLPLFVLWAKPGLLPSSRHHAGHVSGETDSVWQLWRIGNLRTLFIAGGIITSAQDLFQFYFPIYGHSVGISPAAIGTILGTVAAAAFVIRSIIPYLVKKWSESQILSCAVFVAAFAFVLLPLFEKPYALGIIAFILGLGVGCANPMSMSLVYALTPRGRVAESLGLRKTVNNITHLVIPITFGSVGAAFGFSTVFLSNAAILVGGGMLLRKSRLSSGAAS